jgi:hypothetical protein
MKIHLLVIVFFMVCSCQTESPYGSKPQKKYAKEIPQLIQMQYIYEDTILGYRMEVMMPAIQNNPEFSAIVNQYLQENKSHFEEFISDFGRQNNVLVSEFETIQLTDSIISIRQNYIWAVPGTSVLQYSFGHINFQPATREKIRLKDIFREGVDYRLLVTTALKEKIKTEYNVENISINEQDINAFVIGRDYIEFSKVLYPDVMEPEPQLIRIPFSEWAEELTW